MILLGILSFISGLILAYLGGHGYLLGIDPLFIVPVSFVVLLFFLCGASSSLYGQMGWNPNSQPSQRDPDILVRVLRAEGYESEIFIRGRKDDILRDVLLADWPLKTKFKEENWYVVDSRGNEVTDSRFSEFEGTLTIRTIKL